MDSEFSPPRREYTREEINRCYLRWQQLRNEHGANVESMREYQYYTAVLRMAAKQQQQRQQQEPQLHHGTTARAGVSGSPNGVPTPTSYTPGSNHVNGFGGGSAAVAAASAPASVPASVPVSHMSPGTQPAGLQAAAATAAATPASINSNSNENNDASAMASSSRSLFTDEQSLLLKAQIQSLKIMANHMAVPAEIMMVVDRSLTHMLDFKSILLALSADLQAHNAGQQSPQQPVAQQQPAVHQPAVHQPAVHQSAVHQQPVVQQPQQQKPSPRMTQGAKKLPAQMPYQQKKNMVASPAASSPAATAAMAPTPQQQPFVKSKKLSLSVNSAPTVGQMSPATPNTMAVPSPVVDAPRPASPPIKDQEPPKQEPPVLLSTYKKQHQDIEKIIDVNSPHIMVDCFSYPEHGLSSSKPETTSINYIDLLNQQNLYITPSLLPVGLDPRSAMETYQTHIALDLDTSLDFCLQQLLDSEIEAKEKKDLIMDYNAMQLLPLQKAVRGYLLSFEWYQSTLLTNIHPNFLSKNRSLNLQDALLTRDLFKLRELQQFEKQQLERSSKLNSILGSCKSIHETKIDKKAQRVKLGHRLINLHANLEKEEQKRVERNAKQRLQALKANDEEAYIKLLDQTKDTRITHLLKQTNTFLDSLTKAVKDQQSFTKDKIDSHIDSKEKPEEINGDNDGSDSDDDIERERIDYYEVAHSIKEEVKQQPSILVGGTLKEYQVKGLQWMVSLFNNHLNGILADEMGLGKTIQTISLLTYLYEVKEVHGPFLVIVPLSTLTNWNAEFDKWAPKLKKIAFKGPPMERKPKQAAIRNREFDVVLTTFEYIIKERPLLSKIKWVHTIIDEGHRMKNAQSKLSLTLNTYYHSDYRLILTGTPLQNNLPELWALLNFVLPKIFNSVKSFDEWFNTPFANTGGQDKIALSEEETLLVIRRLHKVLRPFLLRRLKKDVEKDLPDKVEKVLKCKMSALQHKLYQQMLKHRRLFIFDDSSNQKFSSSRGFNNQIMQLRKICNHPFVFEEVEDQINPARETSDVLWRTAGKFELLERILPKFKATGHRVLIFFQMTQVMDIMEDFLRHLDMKYLRLDGHTKSDDRTLLLNTFNAPNSEYFCFLLSTRAGGLGLNLQTADTVIIFDTDWNPHQDLQAQDRAHRIGQKNEVRILRLITDNSVEEAILEKAHAKLDIDGKVIQAGKFDNKSTAEEQEALLRSLLEAEEEERKRRELGIEEEEQLDDSELNEILARNEGEIKVFQDLDAQRIRTQMESGITNRLMENSELPECYNVDIDAKLAEEEKQNVFVGGRGNRERRTALYSDELSEEQWLRQFEVSDNDDEDDEDGGRKRRRRRTENNAKRAKLELPDELDGPATGTENTPVPDPQESNGNSAPPGTGAGKTSVKTAKKTSKGRKKTSSTVRKNGRNYLRSSDSLNKSLKERQEISQQARTLYDYAVYYRNADDRRLSDIFLVKPSKRLYPDYYLLIKYPAAFENVMKHIDLNLYDSLKQVVEDFHLIFANARIYNTEDSIIYKDSLELEDAVITKWKEMTNETEEIDFSEFDEGYATPPLIQPSTPA
ncbi:unnamed protein product [Kluyveromyces dobzhanskii CBS 2104]|uniref:WGS project CCBQ000000000 data, contig 00041 n=1 Tax=Kluyveromyces dobzhanskii CBS 2104 TaxID=1427455 RepID=A0A0A8L2I9_9SACH|nr:unnamed protein product [Kluyveromyces dobzhanskii CBS 2104]